MLDSYGTSRGEILVPAFGGVISLAQYRARITLRDFELKVVSHLLLYYSIS